MDAMARTRVQFVIVTFFVSSLVDTTANTAANELPRIFILHPRELAEARKQLQEGDPALQPALRRLRRDADHALKSEIYSVTLKQQLPPSGDKHDYLSVAPYWWPNPNTNNGLPYIRRDGEINPERDRIPDRKRLDQLVQGVKTLALTYYFTGVASYAEHAAKLLRVWFLDEATRMNPHLRYAQSIPGRSNGRAEGIIETHSLPELIDAVGLLQGSTGWSQNNQKFLQDWFQRYLNWLRESPAGKAEDKAQNNHGTWYDVQVASFALFAGRDEVAKQVVAKFAATRITKQIAPEGRQPHELTRAQPWHYSIFNLEALFDAAALADKVGIDLWKYETSDNRGLRKALDWLIPFAMGEKKWTHKEITSLELKKLAPSLRRAALAYREPRYEEAIAKLPKLTGDEPWRLLYPNSTNR